MVVTHGSLQPTRSRCALTIGNFDGVHRGHRALIERVTAKARELSVSSCVLTFEPHPREFFAPLAAPARLTRLRDKLELMAAAGYVLTGTELREQTSGRPFAFEILVTTRDQERLALAFARDLRRAGIDARLRVVDAVQYDRRLQTFDFDMIQFTWAESLSPGNEQAAYWGSAAADEPGSRNHMGVRSTAIDAMIAALLEARERPAFVSAVRALDRVLMSGFYAVPVFNVQEQWIARWNRIEIPAATALTGYLPETWWQKPPAK